MRKIVLYIAMSLDGYIADENGKVDWLDVGSDIDTYSPFIKNIDTIIMGWNTYHQVVNELADTWPYDNLLSYVCTHRNCHSTDKIQFTNMEVKELIDNLKKQDGKDIWICGGANLIAQCMKENLIDTYHITMIPTILGKGIHLFNNSERIPLILKEVNSYGDICEVVYEKRKS